jgi:hypothetical protein
VTARTFSIMPVRYGSEPKAIERPVHSLEGSLRVGSRCLVEFGGTWAYRGREPIRMPGAWYRCRVVALAGAIVHVALTDD